MRTLYLDCSMGAAGDMLAAALLELYGDRDGFIGRMNALGIPGVTVRAEDRTSCGVRGTRFRVSVLGGEEHEHGRHGQHRGISDIQGLIASLPLPGPVREDAAAVYSLIADAESRVHGVAVEQVHLHEVGALDAVADIAAVCTLMHELSPDTVCASPVNVGGGSVKCAHGVLPVPAPAAALLLQGVPIYGGGDTELCTPTGAALLKYYVRSFSPLPAMTPEAVGYGMGSRDIAGAMNGLRAMLGGSPSGEGRVVELACNLDDMTGEDIGFAMERLLAAGALDVWTTPIGMKKCRPGVMLSCLCAVADADALLKCMFRHTSTLGIREYGPGRHTLSRRVRETQTSGGTLRVKTAVFEGQRRDKPEFEDLARIAREGDTPLAQLRREAETDL